MNEERLLKKFLKLQFLYNGSQFNSLKYKGGEFQGRLYRGQSKVLSILKDNPGITQKELLENLNVTPQSLSEYLTKLEKKALISKTQSNKDRRVMIVKLTEAGKKAAKDMKSFKKSSVNLFKNLTEEEKNTLNNIFDKIIDEFKHK